MLIDHFTHSEWAHIDGNEMQVHSGTVGETILCNRILYNYTKECYSIEAIIRDFDRYESASNIEYHEVFFGRFMKLLAKLENSDQYQAYLHLPGIIRKWTRDERNEFFMRKNCLNGFGAPIHERITAKKVKDSIIFSDKLTHTRVLTKKRDLDIPRKLIPEKKLKLDRSTAQKSQSSSSVLLAVCSTKKYIKTFKNYQRWITSKPIGN